jgi:iron complex outermembrane recepter protein
MKPLTSLRVSLVVLALAGAARGDVAGEAEDIPPEAAAPAGAATAADDSAGGEARTAASHRVIEEIVVTAQKREQFVEDVPISMSVIDSKFIAEQGITDVREAALFVPNAKVEIAGFFAAPRVRGFSFNNNNKAFEPPAGLAVDGVPYTRIGYFQSALFDLERLEVLRGPQGTTFGKNTTAGLFSVVTRDPSPEYTGHVDVQLGEYDRHRAEGAIGGPLVRESGQSIEATKLFFRMSRFGS